MRARQYPYCANVNTQHTFSKFIEHIKLVVVVKGFFYILAHKQFELVRYSCVDFLTFRDANIISNVQFNCVYRLWHRQQEQTRNQIEQKLCKQYTYCIALELTIAIAIAIAFIRYISI